MQTRSLQTHILLLYTFLCMNTCWTQVKSSICRLREKWSYWEILREGGTESRRDKEWTQPNYSRMWGWMPHGFQLHFKTKELNKQAGAFSVTRRKTEITLFWACHSGGNPRAPLKLIPQIHTGQSARCLNLPENKRIWGATDWLCHHGAGCRLVRMA